MAIARFHDFMPWEALRTRRLNRLGIPNIRIEGPNGGEIDDFQGLLDKLFNEGIVQ